MISSDPVVSIDGLHTRVGGRPIHRDLSLDIQRGEVLSIIGGSGAGKTVLLRHIVGLARPAAGTVKVFGHDLSSNDAETQRAIRRRWGVLFQGGALFSALSVFDNVALPLRELRSLDARTIRSLVLLRVRSVGLKVDDAGKLPAELSGGMVKRAALARSLALDPELLFLDEPTAGLDPVAADAFQELIRTLRRELDMTIVMITHDLPTLSALSDRVAVLADQRIVAVGPLDEVKASEHPFIQEYFSDERARA